MSLFMPSPHLTYVPQKAIIKRFIIPTLPPQGDFRRSSPPANSNFVSLMVKMSGVVAECEGRMTGISGL